MKTNFTKHIFIALALMVVVISVLIPQSANNNLVHSVDSASPALERGPASVHVLHSSIRTTPTQPLTSVSPQPTRAAAFVSSPRLTRVPTYVPRSQPSILKASKQPVPQQLVIKFDEDATDAERKEYIVSIGGTVAESIDSLDTVVVNVSAEVAQQPLPESSVVTTSEPDYYISALDDLAPVNDPRYAEQWALPTIGAPLAWAELPANAPKVIVAVIDSGICASHPDLASRIVNGWDFLENDAAPQDDFGHGCSVSGVIAANMNNGIGIAGVAPNAQIMPLRVLNASGVGSYSDVAAAIVYAADHGAQIINLSLGGSNPSSMLEDAVSYAISKGVVVVAAAGNSGTEGVLYPAAYPDVIAVGSIDPNLQHSTFSNYGSQIDIWAPGRDILTTKRDGSYGLVSGTSFATPYVAGAEAVSMALNRALTLNADILSLKTQIIETVTSAPTAISTGTSVPLIIHTDTPIISMTPTTATPGYLSDRNGEYSFNYPINWIIVEDRYWSDDDLLTFDSLVKLKSPDKEVITISTWRNIEPLSIKELSSKYLYPILEDTAQPYGEGLINQNSMVLAIELGKEKENPTTISSLFQCGASVYNIKYIGYNGGSNVQVFRELLGSLICINGTNNLDDSIPEITSSQFVIPPSVLEGSGTTCKGFYDPTSNRYSCGQCTWWASYSRPDIPDSENWGDAYMWYDKARYHGDFGSSMVSISPEVGAIAVWNSSPPNSTCVPYDRNCDRGHVAYVIRNNFNGTFVVSDMNWNCPNVGTCAPQERTVTDTDNINFILGGVTLFENQDFGGSWHRTRTSQSNISYGWGISSVFIPSGWDAILYKNSNYDSSSWRERWGEQTVHALDASFWDLQLDYFSDSSNMNDNVRSIKTGLNICIQPYGLDQTGAGNLGCGGPPPTQTPAAPPGTIDGLKLISVSSPTVQKGQTFAVSVTYEVVSGQLLQSRGDLLFGFDPNYSNWPHQAVVGTINPGQQVAFNFNLTAPQQTGTFESKWQLMIGGQYKGPQAIIRFAVQDTSPPQTGGGPWNSQAWQNKYLAGNPNWTGQWTWSNNYPYVDFNWGSGAPLGWGGNEFSMRLWKTIHFPGGYYSFHTSHDDGVRVYLDNTMIIDAWWDGSGGHDIGKNISAGDHEVKVEYYENQGDAFVKAWWYGPGFPEPDTNPPDGRITSPTNNSATASSPLTITADASDDVSGVNRVEFYVNYCDGACGWRLISTDYSLPYSASWDWSGLTDQHIQLTTHMIDNTGKVRNDPGGYVDVNLDRTKPAVSITSPLEGALLNGDTITITANASDSLSGVRQLQFFVDYNESVGTGAQSISGTPSPAVLGDTAELSAAGVSAQGWHEIGWDQNGADGWSLGWAPGEIPNQSGISIFIYAYDYAGNFQGTIRSNLTLSRQEPVDILYNGSFEIGDSMPLKWQTDAWTMSYSTFEWSNVFAHSGNRSIKISNNTANDARLIQTVYVQPNSEYRLSGWIKTQNVGHSQESQDAGANLSLYGSYTKSLGLFGPNDWTYVTLDFNTGSSTQITVAARLGMWSGTTIGTAWFDDLKLELLSTPICYSLTKNIFPNGSGSITANPPPNCNNSTQYVHGTQVQLIAIPSSGFLFNSWSGGLTGASNPIFLSMASANSVSANFNSNPTPTRTKTPTPTHPETITISGNAGVGGATVIYTGGTVTSAADGSYSFQVPYIWNGTVTPTKDCYIFTPLSQTYSNVTVSQAGQNYNFALDTGSGCANVDVHIGGPIVGSYGIPSGGLVTPVYNGVQNGPVRVVSTNGALMFTSQVVTSGESYNELMGYPDNQLATEYWFPWYDHGYPSVAGSSMRTWLAIGNPHASLTADVDVYIGGVFKANYDIPPGGQVTPRWIGLQDGPVRIVSTNGVDIFASQRVFTVPDNSFNESMGYPVDQFTTEYWFPWYDMVYMNSSVMVGNTSSTLTANVDIYIGATKKGSYMIAHDDTLIQTYVNVVNGPVRVVSTNGVNIVASQRVRSGPKKSYNELMGYPFNQFTTEYWFPWYDHGYGVVSGSKMRTWLGIGNPHATLTADVDVYIGGVFKGNYDIPPKGQVTPRWIGLQDGPVRIVSTNGVNIFASQRVFTVPNSVFNEMMGYPASQFTDQYWFPWYDSIAMNSRLFVGNP